VHKRVSENGDQTFISGSDLQQVAEDRWSCVGSNKPISVERDSFGEEPLLEPLSLVEGSLHPEVGGTRQDAFCKGQDDVELFEPR
jgi:hypothetical protein